LHDKKEVLIFVSPLYCGFNLINLVKNKIMFFELTNLEATTKVKRLLTEKTYEQMAEDIGISKPTLFTRLSLHNWKKGEKALIQKM
jgi:hypothetical protein